VYAAIHSNLFEIPFYQKNHGIQRILAIALDAVHCNGNGKHCNAHVQIGSIHPLEMKQSSYRNKPIDRSIWF